MNVNIYEIHTGLCYEQLILKEWNNNCETTVNHLLYNDCQELSLFPVSINCETFKVIRGSSLLYTWSVHHAVIVCLQGREGIETGRREGHQGVQEIKQIIVGKANLQQYITRDITVCSLQNSATTLHNKKSNRL